MQLNVHHHYRHWFVIRFFMLTHGQFDGAHLLPQELDERGVMLQYDLQVLFNTVTTENTTKK